MRVDSTEQAASGQNGTAENDAAERPVASRALVALGAVAAYRPAANYRQSAFLAHLIATKDQLPQTRARRRAEPCEVIAAYRAAAVMTAQ